MMRRRLRAWSAGVLTLAIVLGTVALQTPQQPQAQVKSLMTMEQARVLALRNSSKAEQLENKLETQKVQKAQAEKSLAMRKKSMSTFRWTPLLSFKFPTNPDYSEAYEFAFKATSLQAEIDTTTHELDNLKFDIYEQVNNLYLDIVALESTGELLEDQISELEKSIAKNSLRLLEGLATQTDIDNMYTKLESLKSKLASNQRDLASKKKKLAELTGDDAVQTDYRFEGAYVEADLSRTTDLPELISYTLDHDQTYYEACSAKTTARLSLTTTYQLMAGQFSSSAMGLISDYYYQALRGEKLNSREFKTRYKEFLKKIDEPWDGKKKILFIRIPKEWFKGDTDGSRYIEDEPYALYEAALEYQDARLTEEEARSALQTQVEDAFDNYVSLKSAYEESVAQVEAAKEQLEKERILNRLGSMTYEEFTSSMENYETLQTDMLDALRAYSSSLYEFDKLTCGALTTLIEKGSLSLNAAVDGDSVLTEENVGGSRYTITQIVQNEEFRLSISLAEELQGAITHYELWCDNIQVGERTEIDRSIRHLALALDDVERVYLRFYDGDTFVDECEIDPSVLSDELKITTGYTVTHTQSQKIGIYTCTRNELTGLVEIGLKPDAEESVAYYRIRTDVADSWLGSEEYFSISAPFKYLGVIEKELGALTIEFYDTDKNLLYTGSFEVGGSSLLKDEVQE